MIAGRGVGGARRAPVAKSPRRLAHTQRAARGKRRETRERGRGGERGETRGRDQRCGGVVSTESTTEASEQQHYHTHSRQSPSGRSSLFDSMDFVRNLAVWPSRLH